MISSSEASYEATLVHSSSRATLLLQQGNLLLPRVESTSTRSGTTSPRRARTPLDRGEDPTLDGEEEGREGTLSNLTVLGLLSYSEWITNEASLVDRRV